VACDEFMRDLNGERQLAYLESREGFSFRDWMEHARSSSLLAFTRERKVDEDDKVFLLLSSSYELYERNRQLRHRA
jgi:hypothetical protein